MMVVTIKLVTPLGKARAIILQRRKDGYFYARMKYVNPLAEKFTVKKGETHTIEMEAAAFTQGSKPVLFYDNKMTRPMIVNFENEKHDVKAKKYNPSSEEFDTYATRQGFLQLLRANAVGNPGLVFLIIVGAMGFAFGFIAGPLLSPHYVPIPIGNGTEIHTTVTQ